MQALPGSPSLTPASCWLATDGCRYDYPCSGSHYTTTCVLDGTAEELAPRCDADPACSLMAYLPEGRDYLGEPLIAVTALHSVCTDHPAISPRHF